jgi:hypothetical protein
MRAISEVHQEPSLAAKILHHRASYQLLVLTLAIGCALIFTFASYRVGIFYGQDIPAHLSWAKQLAEQGVTYLPHFTYQQMVVIVRALLPFSAAELIQKGLSAWLAERSYKIAGLLVLAIFYGLTAILIQRRLYSTLQTIKSKHSGALSILFTLVLMLVAPINLLTISQHRLYLGYIGINVYHNPTVIMLKPMALVIFWLILGWISTTPKPAYIFGLAFLTVYSTFTKPNFTICLLPVVCMWLIYRRWKKQPLRLSAPLMGFILPAIVVLGYQYWFAYLESGATHIVFAPLLEMKYYAPHGLGWMFILSFLFPLAVLIMQFHRAIRDEALLLAWGVFLVGSATTYLLAEQGARQYNLNFEWGAQVGLFILFIQTTLFSIKNWKLPGTDGKQLIPLGQKIVIEFILSLHFMCGVIWYLAEVLQPHLWWQ